MNNNQNSIVPSYDDGSRPQRTVKYTIQIAGRCYRLKSDGSVDELKAIGQLVNKKIAKLKAGNVYFEKYKIYLSAALELAEEYVRLQQDYKSLLAENAELRKRLENKTAE